MKNVKLDILSLILVIETCLIMALLILLFGGK